MFAERLAQVQPSATLKVAAEADRLRRAGVDVVDFSAGEPETPDTDVPDSEAPPPDAGTMGVPVGTLQIQERMQAAMFVSRVEDRFGNALTYNSHPTNPLQLLSIVASDGFASAMSTPVPQTLM